jgi:predicted transcriptional regulator
MNNDETNRMGDPGVPGPFGEIPKKLKEYYDSLQDEAIPPRFLDLLEQLDQAERLHAGKKQPLMTEENGS